MARPRKEFDQDQFEKLCYLQCTESEIANWFDMCRDTLISRIQEKYNESFSTIYKKFADEGKMSLRRIQFRLAENNVAMAIWLGKQLLGQKDDAPIQVNTYMQVWNEALKKGKEVNSAGRLESKERDNIS